MFKKIYKKIDAAEDYIVRRISGEISYLKSLIDHNRLSTDQLKYTIEVQRQTIELLTNILQDKYEIGLLVVHDKHDKFVPLVIKDGKVLTDGKIKSASIYWETGYEPDVEICR